MDLEKAHKLASLIDGTLTGAQRAEILDGILSDAEASKLLGLLVAPELRPANTAPLPFEVEGIFIGGWCEDYFLPLSSKSVDFGTRSRRRGDRLRSIAGSDKRPCFPKRFELEFPTSPDGSGLEIQISIEEGSIGLRVYPLSSGCERCNVEYWEGGEIVRSSPLLAWTERPPYRLEPETSVFLRCSESSVGLEILISEIEFSPRLWRMASLVACLEGNLKEALRVCREKLQWEGGRAVEMLTPCGWISALQPLTKSDGFVLKPTPLTRGNTSTSMDLRDAYQPVWSGIVRCWPVAAKTKNPWAEVCPIDDTLVNSDLGLDPDIEELVNACIGSASIGPHAGEAVSDFGKSSSGRPDLANGWAALHGIAHLVRREFDRSLEAFTSVQPIPSDPFGLTTGAALAQHLIEVELHETNPTDLEGSTDRVWKSLFKGELAEL
jgi:hypothetical protein